MPAVSYQMPSLIPGKTFPNFWGAVGVAGVQPTNKKEAVFQPTGDDLFEKGQDYN
jgi:hypothetical protein